MRNRAVDFRDKATSLPEKNAWNKVIDWCNSFLRPEFRIITKGQGAIGLDIEVDRFNEVFSPRND